MEKLYQLKPSVKRSLAYLNQDQITENKNVNQLVDSHLMDLFKQIKKGDIKAMETLSIQYIQMIIKIAGEFNGYGLTDLEMIIKGNARLINAAENFDESRGIDFSAYAKWSVRQAIIQAIDEYEFNKPIPLNKIGLLSKKTYWNQNNNEKIGQLI